MNLVVSPVMSLTYKPLKGVRGEMNIMVESESPTRLAPDHRNIESQDSPIVSPTYFR
jgi:hypothetical protein